MNPVYQALVAAVARSNVTVLAGPGDPRRRWGITLAASLMKNSKAATPGAFTLGLGKAESELSLAQTPAKAKCSPAVRPLVWPCCGQGLLLL